VLEIRGRVLTRSGLDAGRTSILLYPAGDPGASAVGNASTGRDGEFEFSAVAPGAYALIAVGSGTAAPVPGAASDRGAGQRLFGRAFVNVVDSNLESVQLELDPGFEVGGAIAIDTVGEPDPSLWSPVRVRLNAGSAVSLSSSFRAGPDGTFVLSGVNAAADYTLEVTGIPDGFRLVTARLGGLDLTGGVVRFPAQPAGRLEVRIERSAPPPPSVPDQS
jgi:hypothetical protein